MKPPKEWPISARPGDLGNTEALLALVRTSATRRRRTAPACAPPRLVDGITDRGPRCGVPLGLETPGLMPGLAGIGYALLRLTNVGPVPSILLLEPPVR